VTVPSRPAADRLPGNTRGWTLAVLALGLLPTLVAIWDVPWFITQDGPAHLYNSHIIARSLRPDSPFRGVYEVRWKPLPNWAGHLSLVGLMQVMSPRNADRVMMTVTLVGFALSVTWLRWRVAGWRGLPVAAGLAVLAALNMAWLIGFSSFLVGACLFPITLGIWWGAHERMGLRHGVMLAVLIVVAYFCHLVSMGLTALGLFVLAASTPGPRRIMRWSWTMFGMLPLIPLGLTYHRLMREGGGIHPEWGHLKNPLSLASWGKQLSWIDPLTLASKRSLPFLEARSAWFGLLAPVLWFSAVLALFVLATLERRKDGHAAAHEANTRRGWVFLAGLLFLGGLIGPDTMGAGHGNYLPQRVFLLGLAAIIPYMDFDPKRWQVRAAIPALAVALVVQSATVWSYALEADRLTRQFLTCREQVGRNQRVGALMLGIRGIYRASPLLHVDSLLGIGTGNVLWSNYETGHYYFPVQFVDAPHHPQAADFEAVTILDSPADQPLRREYWNKLLESCHGEIDVLVVWGKDPALDAITERWFRLDYEREPVRVFNPRDRTRASSPDLEAGP
jgi:hypothetical protein